MRKKTLMIFSAVAILLLGCNKSVPEVVTPPIGGDKEDPIELDDSSDEKMTFSGSQLSSKAVFSDSDDGSLHWSPYDNLGVYSVNSANSALVHSGTALIQGFTGSEAAFESTDSRADWAGSGSAQNLVFYAYYPQLSSVPTYDNGVIPLSVSDFQNGEFGRYQVCYSSTTPMSATDVKSGKEIKFNFTPATAVLRVRIAIEQTSDIDNLSIRELIVQIAGGKSLAGDFALNLQTGSVNITSGKSQVRVTFTQPIGITKFLQSNPYINLAILPGATNRATLDFMVVATDGKTYLLKSKLSPPEFVAGKRYSTDRYLSYQVDPETTPDGMYILGGDGWEGVPIDNDGSYTDSGEAW